MIEWIGTSLFGFFVREGVGDRWICWIKGFLMEPFFSIILNGTSKGFF